MQELQKRLAELKENFLKAYEKLAIEEKLGKVAELEEQVAEPEIWKDVKLATEKNQELAELKTETEPWSLIKTQIEDMGELMEMSDEDLKEEIEGQIAAMEEQFAELKKSLRFTGPYDANNAIMRITSGAGGTEAMDWAGMLERMYLRYFEKKGFKVRMLTGF